jgi:hypothetical protein
MLKRYTDLDKSNFFLKSKSVMEKSTNLHVYSIPSIYMSQFDGILFLAI